MAKITELSPGTWNVDPSHSALSFSARHLMISKVRGHFASFGGEIEVTEDPLASTVHAVADTASITTGDESRDGHLKSADFFDVEHYPTLSFVSTSIEQDGSDFRLAGLLTVKDITKPVVFDLEFDGVTTDPWGNTKAGFSAETEINRKDFGLEWNVALETGGVLVGEKVKIQLDIEAVKA
jgi:polyisoprenoid-binding protein YceI